MPPGLRALGLGAFVRRIPYSVWTALVSDTCWRCGLARETPSRTDASMPPAATRRRRG